MKPPNHPTPSGDRQIASLLLKALTSAGFDVDVVSDLRSWEGVGDRQHQRHLKQRGQREATRLIDHYQTRSTNEKPICWFTYHLYHKAPDWIGPPVSEALGIPYIIAEASVAPKQVHGKWKEGYRCSIDALHKADLVFNLNPADRAQIEKHISSKTHIVDLKPFLALPPQNTDRHLIRQQIAIEKKIDADHYWLLCVAMMRAGSKLESYRVLADTLDHLQRKDWELIVIGGGSMHDEIKQAFTPYRNVHLLGVQEKAYIYQCMYACNLFVWPAVNEAFGMAVLEALACGLPVIAGNSGGIGQLVQQHQTGVLIEGINGANLARQIEHLLDNPSRLAAMSRHSQARFHACHTLERGARQLKENMLPLLKPTTSDRVSLTAYKGMSGNPLNIEECVPLPTVVTPLTNTVIIGFDSAWADKSPGAACALSFDDCGRVRFERPQRVNFREALCYIAQLKVPDGRTVVAIDQPTIVPNATGMRPAERIAASVLSYTGGGVQPANKGKEAMFGDKAPIWQFKKDLGAEDNPGIARNADFGLFLIEVFPALALSGLHASFAGRHCAPKYNPKNRKMFRIYDWDNVVSRMNVITRGLGLEECAKWCESFCTTGNPTKRHQDQLDALICAIIGYIWLACRRSDSMMLGDLESGYIVTPVLSCETKKRLKKAATEKGVESR